MITLLIITVIIMITLILMTVIIMITDIMIIGNLNDINYDNDNEHKIENCN